MDGRITDPAALAALPDGTVVASVADCRWPARYARRRWRKGAYTMLALDPDPFTGERVAALLSCFADPLPVVVIGYDPSPPLSMSDIFGD